MAFLSFQELVDIVAMSLVVGWIFKDILSTRMRWSDPDALLKNVTPGFRLGKLSDYWYAVLLVAPSIILHEFGHKLTAMGFGLTATFHAAYTWLGIAVILKALAGVVFFVPAYVSIIGAAYPWQYALIAFAGPAVNGLLWLGSKLLLEHAQLDRETAHFVALARRINGFLFVFNMIPIPGFDGYQVLQGLARTVF